MRPVNPSEQKDNRNLKPGSFPNASQNQGTRSNQNDQREDQNQPEEPPGHEVEVGEREGDFPPDIKMNQIDEDPQSDANLNQRSPGSGPGPDYNKIFQDGIQNQNQR